MIKKLIGKLLGKEQPAPAAPAKKKRTSAPKSKSAPKSQSSREGTSDGPARKRRRRGGSRSGGRAGQGSGKPSGDSATPSGATPESKSSPSASGNTDRQGGPRKRRRRSGRGRSQNRNNRAETGSERSDSPRKRGRYEDREPVEESAVQEPVVTGHEEAAPPPEAPPASSENSFLELGLENPLARAVEEMGYEQPTPIQSEAIPLVLSGRDVIASAQTGTGKTAAFGLPVLQMLGNHGRPRCLILEPTRELAAQVEESFLAFSKYTNLRTAVLHGGVGYGLQREHLRRGLDVVVATPGRLLDHMEQRALSLGGIEYLVLDEVDRMLDMGFLPDVKRIVQKCPKERQTLFFSATIPPAIERLTEWVLKDPHVIEIGARRSPAETVSHAFYPVVQTQKFDLFVKILERTHYESVLIFCRTKIGADMIARRLENLGHPVAVMHSNRSQSERTEALAGFKSGKYDVLVATDIAARGLDVAGITHVINYDVPLHPEDYVHRIGRTGRAQAEGDAFTLLTEDEIKHAKAIERYIGRTVERKKLDDFDYHYSAVFAEEEAPPKNQFKSRLYRGQRR